MSDAATATATVTATTTAMSATKTCADDVYSTIASEELTAFIDSAARDSLVAFPAHLVAKHPLLGSERLLLRLHEWTEGQVSRLTECAPTSLSVSTASFASVTSTAINSSTSSGNNRLQEMESRLWDKQSNATSTIGFAAAAPAVSVLSAKKKIAPMAVPQAHTQTQTKTHTHAQTRPQSTTTGSLCRNLAFLYCALLVTAQPSEVETHSVISLLCRLAQVCSSPSLYLSPEHGQSLSFSGAALRAADCAQLLRLLVEGLLPLVRAAGRNVLRLLLRCPALSSTSVLRDTLQDQLDASHRSLGQPSQDRLCSYMAESYVKPFSDEDNRHEQKSKEDKDLYKSRAETNDKLLNLFQLFRDIAHKDGSGSDSAAFFADEFETAGREIMSIDTRNFQWLARMFVGLYVRHSLIPHEAKRSSVSEQQVAQQAKEKNAFLEQRMGTGGALSVRQSLSVAGVTNTTTSTATAATTSAKRVGMTAPRSAKSTNARTQQQTRFASPFDFEGELHFFSRFVLQLRDHRFNQCLAAALVAEIAKHCTEDVKTSNTHTKTHTSANTNTNTMWGSDANAFTLSLLMLKSLARLLGLLHFHHLRDCRGPGDNPDSDGDRALFTSHATLPLAELLSNALLRGRLCLVVPWITEYLKMLRPVLDSTLGMSRSPCVYFAYHTAFRMLYTLPRHHAFQLFSEDLSSNRLYVLLEIESLWKALPNVLQALRENVPAPDSLMTFESPSSVWQEQQFLRTQCRSQSLDAENIALTDMSLRALCPQLRSVFDAERAVALRSPATAMNTLTVVKKTTRKKQETSQAPLTSPDRTTHDKTNVAPPPLIVPGSPLISANKGSGNSRVAVSVSRSSRAPSLVGASSVELNKLRSPQRPQHSRMGLIPSRETAMYRDTKNQDLLDSLDDVFWNHNKELLDIHKFLLSYTSSIGQERVQAVVCLAIHALSRRLDAAKRDDFSLVTESCCKQVVCGGLAQMDKLYDFVVRELAVRIYSLCTKVSSRTVRLACWKTQSQLRAQKQYLSEHLREYATRKLGEVQERKSRRCADDAVSTTINDKVIASPVVPLTPNEASAFCVVNDIRSNNNMQEKEYLFAEQTIASKISLLRKMGLLEPHTEETESGRDNFKWSLEEMRMDRLSSTLNAVLSITMSTAVLSRSAFCLSSNVAQYVDPPHEYLSRLLISLAKAVSHAVSNNNNQRLRTELSLFVLAALPYWLTIDLRSSVCIRTNEIAERESPPSLMVDFVALLVQARLLGGESLHRFVAGLTRSKSSAFFEHCRGLRGLAWKPALLMLFRRIASLQMSSADENTVEGIVDDDALIEKTSVCLGHPCADFFKNLLEES